MGFLDGIFKPKWKHKDLNVRLNSIEKVTNQKDLEYIALNDDSSHMR